MDREKLESQHPELFAEVKALGAAEVTVAAMLAREPEAAEQLRLEGESRERARVVEIFEAAGGQGVLLQVIQDGSECKVALKLFLVNHDRVKAEGLVAMRGAAPPVVGTEKPVVETHTDPVQDAPIETRAKAEWDKDSKLQAEFGGKFEAYLTYLRQEEAGNIKGVKKN